MVGFLLTIEDPLHQRSSDRGGDDQRMGYVTQAGYKRLRTSKACQTCRNRKLRCDAGQPSCSTCLRHKLRCFYDMSSRGSKRRRSRGPQSDNQPEQRNSVQVQGDKDLEQSDTSSASERCTDNLTLLRSTSATGGSPKLGDNRSEWVPLPSGQNLAPYLDSYLTCVHPICFQNILHPGLLSEGFEEAPRLLLLSICGASAKFLTGANEKDNGRRWIAEAKHMIMRDLDTVSTLNIVVLQTIALHDVHEAHVLSAWNLTGIYFDPHMI
jgi:Fungal Zn(2)-Cys(6) binuclear cluster domain